MTTVSLALEWLSSTGLEVLGIEALAGDVSPRRYFRVQLADRSAILAGYPQELAATAQRFVRTGELLHAAGVRVPEVLQLDPRGLWMLMEDLGSATLYDSRHEPWDRLQPWLQLAVEAIRRMEGLSASALEDLNPLLDTAALEKELEQTFSTFLVPQGLVTDAGIRRELEAVLGGICRRIGRDLVPCHRDFMARNLVPLVPDSGAGPEAGPGASLGVLDHQDLRLGPRGYDLASLFNDSLFLPPELEDPWLASVLPDSQAVDAYRRAAVQRTFKAVGTFAAFAQRGVSRHLPLIPPTLERGLLQLQMLPEGSSLANDLRQRWRQALP